MSLTSEEITAKNFKKFYEALSPYLGSYDKGKLTFVGEVKAFFAETAPDGFLICDGATYNKADYPQLANLLLSLTDHSAYEVSGDDTKFKVPDLRGEFLRGSGTNSHTNQGSGGAVGEHQDGTEQFHPIVDGTQIQFNVSSNESSGVSNPDYMKARTKWIASPSGSSGSSVNANGSYTSRPTNTSVLYCIAYKDTMVDLDFLSYGGERFAKSDMYDTNERVIGKWIDGKPLYQKIIDWGAGPNAADVEREHGIADVDKIIEYWGIGNPITPSSSVYSIVVPFTHDKQLSGQVALAVNQTKVNMYCRGGNQSTRYFYIIVRYTKTTDTADSFKYSTPTDYSTEEKIVGTWIDGKPLYQKTIDLGQETNINNSTWTSIGLSSTGYKMIVSASGCTTTDARFCALVAAIIQTDSELKFKCSRYDSSISLRYITIQYTKTTDA